MQARSWQVLGPRLRVRLGGRGREAAPQPHQLHQLAAGPAGALLPRVPLPGRVHAGGDRHEAGADRVARPGLVPEQARQVAQDGEHEEGTGPPAPQRPPDHVQR